MGLKGNKTAVALALQSGIDVFANPSSTLDVMPVSNLRPNIQGVTIENNEYTGTIHKNGAEVSGKTATLAMNFNLRPPGGADVPLANAFMLGRVLQMLKFTESRVVTAIPAAPEAIGAGPTDQSLKLGVTAASTAGLYKSMALLLPASGATPRQQLTAIRSYSAAKDAVLIEKLSSAASGMYQIPKQLSYVRSISETDPPYASIRFWLDGKRYDCINCSISSARLTVPVSTRDQAQIPQLEITFEVTIMATADEATPAIPSLGPTPKWKDGKFDVAYFNMAGSNMSLDFGVRSASAPDPNKVDGSAASELIESRTTLSMDRWLYRKAEFDSIALADSQAQQPVLAQWGYTSGNMVQIVVPDARPNYQSPNIAEFVTETGDWFIDVADRSVAINFVYF